MSNTKSVEQQLKEAIEASKQTLALSEQVTSLASEKETLSKRLAEIESALSAPKAETPMATDPVIVAKLGELLAEREMTAKVLKDMQATMVRLEKEAAKKADLNEYVKQRMEDGEEGNTPAEKQHLDAGKKKGKKGEMPQFIKDKIEEREEGEAEAEDCEAEDMKHPGLGRPSKGKKAEMNPHHPSPGMRNEANDEEDYGLTEDEMEMLKEYRQACKMKGKSKKADSTLKAPLKEETKDFGDIIPQPGLDPNKNNVNDDNTTSPSLNKKLAKKVSKAETDVEEIMESTDMQKKEDAEGGEENEVHERTLSKPGKGAKKAEQSLDTKAGEGLPKEVRDYINELIEKEKKAMRAENSLPGMNKHDVVGQPDQDDEESVLNKKTGKKAENLDKCVKDNCADDTTKVHEDGCAPTKGNTTPVGDMSPLCEDAALAPKAKSLDAVVEAAAERFASLAKAKKDAEEVANQTNVKLAAETQAKTEAMAAVVALQAKFEALMGKVAQIETADKTVEAKAAKLISASGTEPVAMGVESEGTKTDEDYLREFEAISDKRAQNKFFKQHADKISRAAQNNLRRPRS